MSERVDRFEQAGEEIKTLPERPDDQALLKLYGLFKQATEGDATGERPGMLDFVGRAKYDAWAKLKGLSNDEAMQSYIDFVEELKG